MNKKNKVVDRNTLDRKSKSNKTIHEVGIKTKFYVNKDKDVFVNVKILGSHNRSGELNLPATTLMYWYPFYFYYDWGFREHSNRWVLKVSETAPEVQRPYLYKSLFLTDCVNINTYETKDNKIHRDNLALMKTLEELSDGTFSTLLSSHIDSYAIRYNYEFIASTIASIKQNCKDRYDMAYVEHFEDKDFEKISTMETARDRLLYENYATDKELSLLIKMGAASRITYILSKLYGEI